MGLRSTWKAIAKNVLKAVLIASAIAVAGALCPPLGVVLATAYAAYKLYEGGKNIVKAVLACWNEEEDVKNPH